MVIGDGQHTVAELVDQVNSDPRRGDGHATPLTRIRFDAIALARLAAQGLTAESVPETGCRVILRNNANLSTGGTATDVTDEVHPQVAARAIEAAHMVGLDVCGVDVVCRDIAQPLEDQGGGVVEVNAAPGLRMHLAPSFGKPRPLGEAIIDTLFPDGHNGRIPTVAVTGTNGKTTTVRLITHLLAQAGRPIPATAAVPRAPAASCCTPMRKPLFSKWHEADCCAKEWVSIGAKSASLPTSARAITSA
jgi:cyanophycin synthetase